MKKIAWCILFIFCTAYGSAVKEPQNETGSAIKEQAGAAEKGLYKSKIYNIYLKHNVLDAREIRKNFFEGNTPEEINLALNDIRKFIENVTRGLLVHNPKRADELYLLNILNIYGWLIRYIEAAYVVPGNRVFLKKRETVLPKDSVPLFMYWGAAEREKGTKLHWYKFYATAIDHLIIFIRSRLAFPCRDSSMLRSRPWWMSWLTDRLQKPLVGNPTFSHYYYKNVQLFKEMYDQWVSELRIQVEAERKNRRNMR
jgi:hypothetical protein